jgi:hypothetical protein
MNTDPNEPFGRQPKRVKITFEGEQIDIDNYARMFQRKILLGTYDQCDRCGNTLTIYPRAVND